MSIDLQTARVVFLGAGNMAEAIISGLVDSGTVPAANLRVTDLNQERLDLFRDQFKVDGTTDNAEAVAEADVVVLAVKPQFMADMLGSLQDAWKANPLVISIAAGLTCEVLEPQLPESARLVRVMPNTPALVKSGMSGIAKGSRAEEADLVTTETLLGSVGEVLRVTEPGLDIITAVSGSGPAYVFYLMEAMIQAGAELGFDPERARALSLVTVTGAAKLMAETGLPADELRRRVTSKGGTTAAAIQTFDDANVAAGLRAGLHAAHRRSIELAKGEI